MKQCRTCDELKPLEGFYTHKHGNVYLDCKPCHTARTMEWHASNPTKRRESNWKHKYGIQGFTSADYDTLYQLQEGCCKVCGRVEPSGRRLAVDHDHSTGSVRGLLCIKCNTTLGWIEAHPEILTYLER